MATAKNPDYWQEAKKQLAKADPILAQIIRQYKGEALASRGSAFFSLARAIVGQQISMISGVAQVNVQGGQKYAVRVQLNPLAMAATSFCPRPAC